MFALILTLFVIPAIYTLRKYVVTFLIMLATLIIGYYVATLSILLPYKIGVFIIAGLIETWCITHLMKMISQARNLEPIQK